MCRPSEEMTLGSIVQGRSERAEGVVDRVLHLQTVTMLDRSTPVKRALVHSRFCTSTIGLLRFAPASFVIKTLLEFAVAARYPISEKVRTLKPALLAREHLGCGSAFVRPIGLRSMLQECGDDGGVPVGGGEVERGGARFTDNGCGGITMLVA
jgi:hypothetical protein